MLLKDLCTLDVACCGPDTTVREAARAMRRSHVGDLVVVDDPKGDRVPIGIVTDRDLVLEVLGNGLDPNHTTVARLMRQPVVIANENEQIPPVIARMRTHGVRRVPVVDAHGATVGIITLDDLLRVLVSQAGALVEIVSHEQNQERRERR
jgi:CBS domain-containing protein